MILKEWCEKNNRLDLLDEWDYEKNYPLTPNDFGSQSHKKVFWKCKKCNISLPCRIQDKVLEKTKCRVCSNRFIIKGLNDLETWCKQNNSEYLLDEWDYKENEKLKITPQTVTHGNDKHVFWICSENHKWKATISSRTSSKSQCPYCSGKKTLKGFNDFKTWCKQNDKEFLLDEWDYKKNKISPDEISPHNSRKIYFICPMNHSYKCALHARTNLQKSQGCPECTKINTTSFPEQVVFFYVKKSFIDAQNSNREILNGKELDIYIPSIKTAIEYDGENYHYDIEKDYIKNKMCKDLEIKMIRIREPLCPVLKDNNSINIILEKRSDLIELEEKLKLLFQMMEIKNVEININKDLTQIYKQYVKCNIDNSFVNKFPKLVKEWNIEKNNPLKPEMFTYKSGKKVWWKCEKCKHEWQAVIGNRTANGAGCPECGKLTTKQKNSKKVLCIDTNEVFDSLTTAAKSKNIKSVGKITECCKGTRKSAGGFRWKYYDET